MPQQPLGTPPHPRRPDGSPHLPPGGPYGPWAPRPPTNQNAILALVLAFVFAPLGIVFGRKAKREIAVSGEEGRTLATAGEVVGWVGTAMVGVVLAVWVLLFVVWAAFAALFLGVAASSPGVPAPDDPPGYASPGATAPADPTPTPTVSPTDVPTPAPSAS